MWRTHCIWEVIVILKSFVEIMQSELPDLYNFLITGNQKDNIILHEGDVIRIPYYKNRVKISGKVKREGKFEMLDSETFNDLLTILWRVYR